MHYIQERIYWIDRNLSAVASVLRSSKFDGTGYQEVSLFRQIDNHTVSTNLTDLTINFNENNTAFFLDTVRVQVM